MQGLMIAVAHMVCAPSAELHCQSPSSSENKRSTQQAGTLLKETVGPIINNGRKALGATRSVGAASFKPSEKEHLPSDFEAAGLTTKDARHKLHATALALGSCSEEGVGMTFTAGESSGCHRRLYFSRPCALHEALNMSARLQRTGIAQQPGSVRNPIDQ
eukprot:TRINITY_DN39657_c0_g1_i2.p1 TRINITY_DN39657_c0_g1~~TRINITY_DN39657_c0_g1_i2.p1  ORF type:complete len:160 (-),score=2.99 TRINITY_DN39657_c0_g1_i2:198-677(-)